MYKPAPKKMLTQEAIPTTSLADMMFLLLIFFIMTTTLTRITGFVTDMPSGSKAKEEQQDKTPTVALHDEKIMVNDKDMTMVDLEKYLRGLRLDQKTGEAKVIVVSAEGAVNYQVYYQTLSLVQSCGGVVAIVTEETGEGGKQE